MRMVAESRQVAALPGGSWRLHDGAMTQLWKEETWGWVGQLGMLHVRHTRISPSAGSLGLVSGITPQERCDCSPEKHKAAESRWL